VKNYLLLLWENPASFAAVTPIEMQRIIDEYKSWRERVAAEGRMVGGQKLRDEGGRRLRGGSVTEGPYAEAAEVIGGLFQITAADYDDAVRISSGCPHLRFGWIELREVEPT
jgi:hypothetical protein